MTVGCCDRSERRRSTSATARRLRGAAPRAPDSGSLGQERLDILAAQRCQPERDLPQNFDIDAAQAEHNHGTKGRIVAQRQDPFRLRRPIGFDQEAFKHDIRPIGGDPAAAAESIGNITAPASVLWVN